jgi:hypothetical protein
MANSICATRGSPGGEKDVLLVLLGKLKKDISFALRRGTIAQLTTHHHALDGFAATPGQRALVRRG